MGILKQNAGDLEFMGQGNDYKTGCLLTYNYFKNYYKLIAIDLSKQQSLDPDPRAIQ